MLIIGKKNAIVYENVCFFGIYPVVCRNAYIMMASMNNGQKISLGEYPTEEEAHNLIETIAQASKETTVFHL